MAAMTARSAAAVTVTSASTLFLEENAVSTSWASSGGKSVQKSARSIASKERPQNPSAASLASR